MVKIIACRDNGWVDFKTDYQQWTHVVRAYNAQLQMINHLQEASIPSNHTVIVVEEQGDVDLATFEHPKDAVYIFGRSGLNGIQNMIEHDIIVRIRTPKEICLFGISAVGIVLHDRLMKNGNENS